MPRRNSPELLDLEWRVGAIFQLGVVLLAAGASSRMGRPKLLLPWGESTVLEHSLAEWRGLGTSQIALVINPAHRPLVEKLDAIGFPESGRIHNANPEKEMFHSIRCAACWGGWTGELTHWAIVLGDQPLVRRETLRQLIAFARVNFERICQPHCGGHRRHPVILPRRVFEQLKSTEHENLKCFLAARNDQRAILDVEDPGLNLDLDVPADYEKAWQLAFDHPPPA
ncbi:MAG: nucleotidyltransferase family protein [Verrucomicrobiota bacterium]